MRERLVATLVGLTIAVIALYGVPRAYLVADLVRESGQDRLGDSATLLATAIQERVDAGGDVDAGLLRRGLAAADGISYVSPDGESVAVGETPTDDDGSLSVARELGDGARLTLTTSAASLQGAVWEAVRPLVLLGLALAGFAAVVGVALARRLSRPFRELADAARELGDGRFDVDVPSYSVPEADAIATSLRRTAERLDRLSRRERQFAANASHQLRTPVTALRLQLEDLALWSETTPAVREELDRGLRELDRLSTSIDDLLALASGRRHGEAMDVDLAALLADTAGRWRTRLSAEGRELTVAPAGVVPARLVPGPVIQVLDVLIDNARLHGSGTITVATRDAGTHLVVTVSDEGVVDVGNDAFRRGVTTLADGQDHGVGLAVATELAELAGGHLSVDRTAPTTTFALWLTRP